MAANSILINIGAKTAAGVKEITKVNKALGDQMTMTERARGAVKSMAAPAAAAFGAVAAAALGCIGPAEGVATANSRVSKIFESMGYADLAADAIAYADALEQQIGVDEKIILESQAKLATFEDVAASADLMKRATMNAANLSAAGFGDMSSVANGLGKALQDPIKGMSLLTKQGSLTKAEQEAIAAQFVATGDKAAAQAAILDALERQTGGVAEVTADTSDKMKLAFGEIVEAIGGALLPAMDAVLPLVQQFGAWAADNADTIVTIGAVIAGLSGAVLLVNGALAVWSAVTTVWTAVTAVATGVGAAFGAVIAFITSPVGLVVAAIAALIAIVVLLCKNWDTVQAALLAAWNALKSAASAVFNWIGSVISTVWNAIKSATSAVWNSIKSLLLGLWNALKAAVTTYFNAYRTIITTIFNAVRTVISSIWNGIKNVLTSCWNGLKSTASSVFNAIKNAISTPFEAIKRVVQTVIDKFNAMWRVFTNIRDKIMDGVKGLVSKIPGFGRSGGPAAGGGGGFSGGGGGAGFGFGPRGPSTGAAGGTIQVVVIGADAKVTKRGLEAYDLRQGRGRGAPLRAAW